MCQVLFPLNTHNSTKGEGTDVESPLDHTQIQWFARRKHRTLKSYYPHGYGLLQWKVQIKISKGKGPGGIRQEILTVLSPWSPTDRWIRLAMMCNSTCDILSTREATQTLVLLGVSIISMAPAWLLLVCSNHCPSSLPRSDWQSMAQSSHQRSDC